MIHLYGGGHDYIQRVVKPEGGGGGRGTIIYKKRVVKRYPNGEGGRGHDYIQRVIQR